MQAFVTSSPSIIAWLPSTALWTCGPRDHEPGSREEPRLTDLFIQLVDERLPGQFDVVTPLDHALRGSQVSLRHSDGYAIIQALIGVRDRRLPCSGHLPVRLHSALRALHRRLRGG